MKTVLIPLPDRDFDTTEVSVPWAVLTRKGHRVVFATEHGKDPPACDPRLLTGVIFGQLGADPEPRARYAEMIRDAAYQSPIAWGSIVPEDYDALLLPGGHAPGMRQYLASEELQRKVAAFWALQRPVAAICHGVLVLARSRSADGTSVLAGARTTCLPGYMEALAYGLTFWKLGRYYRTYPAYVEDEVRAALGPRGTFERGPLTIGTRGTEHDDRGAAFTVRDGRYLSARWPGDAWRFAREFEAML